MIKKQTTVRCPQGLHLRVASQVAKIAQASGNAVHIECEGCPRADACSVIELLMLGATVGTTLQISAEGPAEEAVAEEMAEFFEQGGGI